MVPEAQITQEQFNKLHDGMLANPADFIREVLGANPWHMQVEIINAIFKYNTVAVKTCNSVGKSYIAARIAIAYLMLHHNSIVITTAPTWNQVKNVLWREIRSAIKTAERIKGIKLTEEEASQTGLDLGEKWYALGVSTSTPDNMMGYHADHLLVIVDEAGGVDDLIFNGVRAITTNINNKVLLVGNPTTPDGEFHRSFGPRSMAKQFTISAFDTPNMTANNINCLEDLLLIFEPAGSDNWTQEERVEHFTATRQTLKLPFPELIEAGTVYQRYLEWGIDSPAWQSLVMGEFPDQADQALFPANLVQAAMQMHGETDFSTKDPYTNKVTTKKVSNASINGWQIPEGPMTYGQDMARYGMDSNVLTPRHGGWVEKQLTWNKVSLMDSADRILNIINPLDESVVVNIDDTGNGGGTTDRLIQISDESFKGGQPAHRYKLVAYNFSKGPSNPDKFHDITSEIYWNLREQFMNKAIALHWDEQLHRELLARRWKVLPNKKIYVESKDDYKKRTKGKSPDRSDSLALAFAPRASGTISTGLNTTRAKEEAFQARQDGPIIAGRPRMAGQPASEGSQPITNTLSSRY